MKRFYIVKTVNALATSKHHTAPERLDYLVIPHQKNGKQIDRIGLFDNV